MIIVEGQTRGTEIVRMDRTHEIGSPQIVRATPMSAVAMAAMPAEGTGDGASRETKARLPIRLGNVPRTEAGIQPVRAIAPARANAKGDQIILEATGIQMIVPSRQGLAAGMRHAR